MAVLLFLQPHSKALGALLAIAGVALMLFERSTAPVDVKMRRLRWFTLASVIALTVLVVASLKPPVRWIGLAVGVLPLVVALGLMRPRYRAPQPRGLAPPRDADRSTPLDFGPNAVQVESFLGRLDRLTAAHWKTVIAREDEGVGWQRWLGIWHFVAQRSARGAVERAGRQRQRADALVALIDHPLHEDVRRDYVAMMALDALVVRDRLSEQHFRTLYAPFETVIPAVLLNTPPPPNP